MQQIESDSRPQEIFEKSYGNSKIEECKVGSTAQSNKTSENQSGSQGQVKDFNEGFPNCEESNSVIHLSVDLPIVLDKV